MKKKTAIRILKSIRAVAWVVIAITMFAGIFLLFSEPASHIVGWQFTKTMVFKTIAGALLLFVVLPWTYKKAEEITVFFNENGIK